MRRRQILSSQTGEIPQRKREAMPLNPGGAGGGMKRVAKYENRGGEDVFVGNVFVPNKLRPAMTIEGHTVSGAGELTPFKQDIPAEEWDDLSDIGLSAAYEAEFGKKPHWKMKRETIVERLNDAAK